MKLSSIQMIFKRLTAGQEESSATVPDGSLPSMFEQNWCLYLTHKRTIPSLFLCAGISGSVLCLCPKLDQVLLKGSGFSPSQSASGTKKFFLGPVFLKCASNLCSILMEAYSTGVWGIYNHFISTCWHKTSCTHTHTHRLRASQMVTVMRALGCSAGDVASQKTRIGLDSPQQSLLPLQPATYSCFIRRGKRMTLQRAFIPFLSFFHAQRNREGRGGGGEISVF